MALESRPVKILNIKVNLTMETLMDQGPTNLRMEGITRASFLKTKDMASENNNKATEFTRVNSKTTIPMGLDSSPTLMARSIMANGRMGYITESAHCTVSLKGG